MKENLLQNSTHQQQNSNTRASGASHRRNTVYESIEKVKHIQKIEGLQSRWMIERKEKSMELAEIQLTEPEEGRISTNSFRAFGLPVDFPTEPRARW